MTSLRFPYLKRKTSLLQTLCILGGVIGIPGIMITHVTPQRSDAFFTTKNVATILSLLCLIFFIVSLLWLLEHLHRIGEKIKTLATLLLLVFIGSYFVLILFIVLFQDTFIDRNNVIFQPKVISQEKANLIFADNIENLEFITAEQYHLHGWLVKNGSQERSPLIIYFGGSSQEVSNMIPYFQKMDGWTIALVNYRGYGLSEGNPSETNLFQDATLIYDTLSMREDIDTAKIVTMGWSLGTGVAVYLSEQRPVSGTILVTPFDSWAHMFQSRDFPLIPLSLIKDRYFVFNSIQRAPSIHNPLLCLMSSKDNIVLPALSENLANQWGGETKTIVYEGDHRLLFQENSSWEDISKFLEDRE